MTAELYVFDVDHGQAVGLRLPNGRWCIFDLGATAGFSPVKWILNRETGYPAISSLLQMPPFRFLKATVSHFHGDHLADHANFRLYGSEFMRTALFDQQYLSDCFSSNSPQSIPLVSGFVQYFNATFSGSFVPDYGGATIGEMSLPAALARNVGGDANARVNNASVITRIDIYGSSILICGDMEKDAWEAILSDRGSLGSIWRPFVSNIDILVAPHHGHSSGYSTDLMNLARPAVVLASVVSNDPNVDSRYSGFPVRGISIGSDEYKCITTRQKGHIKVLFNPPSILTNGVQRTWFFGDAAL